MVGYVLKRADRWALPVQLIDIDPDRSDGLGRSSQPGVMTHIQVLRSHLASGLLQPMNEKLRWALCLLAAGLVFFHFRLAIALVVVLALAAIVAGAGLFAIREHQRLTGQRLFD